MTIPNFLKFEFFFSNVGKMWELLIKNILNKEEAFELKGQKLRSL